MVDYNPRQSARLLYRAVETTDEDFFKRGYDDWQGYYQVTTRTALLPSSKEAKGLVDLLMNKSMFSAIICLPPQDSLSLPTRIGSMSLQPLTGDIQHRFTKIGIKLMPEYCGQGYGSEAIRWLLDWGFNRLGMHRIGIDVFEYNPRAFKLYQRLGFIVEGRSRESLFHEGKFWDEHHLSMLEHEWRALKAKAREAAETNCV